MSDILMTVVMLAIIALVLGAAMIWRAGDRRRAVLMIIAALVLAGNVAVWIVPVSLKADFCQCLFQVVDDVLRVFQADIEAQHVFADAHFGAGFGTDAMVSG